MLSIALPVLAERTLLEAAIPQVLKTASNITDDFELIIVSDGKECVDIIESFMKTDNRIIHNHSDTRRGKGGAISDALKYARGDIFCFFDVDLSTDLKHLKELVTALQDDTCDIVIGTRSHIKSTVKRSLIRELFSWGYITYVKHMLKISISDFQCGFKGFKTNVLRELVKTTCEQGWVWDTEILAYALQKKMRILELPVVWTQGTQSNVKASDIFKMALAVTRIKKRLNNERSPEKRM